MTRENVPANEIWPLRSHHSFVRISSELYTRTADPLVVAFHVSAMFHDPDTDPPLTLELLRSRWQVGRSTASTARRTLIDLGFWAEIRAINERGRCSTETVTREAPITLDDLRQLAVEYLPGSKIDCGRRVYRVDTGGALNELDSTTTLSEPSHEKSGSDQVGFVYVVGVPGSSVVKIGTALDVTKRLRQLSMMSPEQLALLWTHSGGRALEAWLHERFHKQRRHGEWFDFGEREPVRAISSAVAAHWKVAAR